MKEDLGLSNRDFSLKWHGITVAAVALVLLAAYFLGCKLFLK